MRSLSIKAASILAHGKEIFTSEDEIFFAASRLLEKGFKEAPVGTAYRLIGVGLTQFIRRKGAISFSVTHSRGASSSSSSSSSCSSSSSTSSLSTLSSPISGCARKGTPSVDEATHRRRLQEENDYALALRLVTEERKREFEDEKIARRLAEREARIVSGIREKLSAFKHAETRPKGKNRGRGKRKKNDGESVQRTLSQCFKKKKRR